MGGSATYLVRCEVASSGQPEPFWLTFTPPDVFDDESHRGPWLCDFDDGYRFEDEASALAGIAAWLEKWEGGTDLSERSWAIERLDG